MKEGFFEKYHNQILTAILVGAFFLGLFFRTWNFNDWVHVKSDQVRDAMLVSHPMSEGVGSLPLLGPKAGGTKLRLGPVFYYFQYVSAEMFNSAIPPVLAYPNLIFSILAIPLFFFFSSLFFSRFTSVFLSLIFSLSFLAVEYARFAWNPNSTIFFSLLFFYSLCRIFSEDEKRRGLWVAVSAVAFSVDSQLHFVSLLGLAVSTFFFLIAQRKNLRQYFSWKDPLIFVLVVLFFYIPVIISDVLTQGSNAREFFEAISGKSSDGSLIGSFKKDAYYFGQYSFRILSGYLGSNKIYHYLGMAMVFSGFAISLLALFSKKTTKSVRSAARLAVVVFSAFVILFIPLADSVDKPRFYLSIIWLPLFFLGIAYEYFSLSWKKFSQFIFVFLVLAFSFSNFLFDFNWFLELSQSDKGRLDPKKTVVLAAKKDPLWFPWGRQAAVAKVMNEDCSEKKVFFSVSKNIQDFSKSIKFAFDKIDKDGRSAGTFKNEISKEEGACFFYVTRNGDGVKSDFQDLVSGNPVFAGSVAVYKLKKTNSADETGKEELLNGDESENISAFSEKDLEAGNENLDVAEGEDGDESVDDVSAVDEGRIKRMYWRDVF